jgi:hypothetical protein
MAKMHQDTNFLPKMAKLHRDTIYFAKNGKFASRYKIFAKNGKKSHDADIKHGTYHFPHALVKNLRKIFPACCVPPNYHHHFVKILINVYYGRCGAPSLPQTLNHRQRLPWRSRE